MLQNSYLGRLEVTYSSNAEVMKNVLELLSPVFPQWIYRS